MTEAANDPSLGGTALQLSGRNEAGHPILSTLAKRTYRLERGRCVLAEQQLPLTLEPVVDREAPDLLLVDSDAFPYKPATDVVVTGSAYNPSRRPMFETSVRVAAVTKPLCVQGDRRVSLDRFGRPVFSEPEPIERLPLSYAFAYGGADLVAERAYGNPADLLTRYAGATITPEMVAMASPFRYPRNPRGRGYLIEAVPEAIDALLLPNLEDPRDLLLPERLLLGDPDHWLAQPIPGGYGWIEYGWFPRVAHFGVVPEHDASIESRWLAEVRFGCCAEDILVEKEPILQSANGASLGLSLPYLRGDEEIELLNLHPRTSQLRFALAAERPKLFVDGREGKLLETEAVMHTLHLDMERELITVLWRGSALARRPYTPEELASMPFAARWP